MTYIWRTQVFPNPYRATGDRVGMENNEHTCRFCGTTDDINDCGEDYGLICDDCGADWYEAITEPA